VNTDFSHRVDKSLYVTTKMSSTFISSSNLEESVGSRSWLKELGVLLFIRKWTELGQRQCNRRANCSGINSSSSLYLKWQWSLQTI
jgi:hypothetical protein